MTTTVPTTTGTQHMPNPLRPERSLLSQLIRISGAKTERGEPAQAVDHLAASLMNLTSHPRPRRERHHANPNTED